MQSWGPSINSFEAFNMNFGYFVQHNSPLKKNYWYFLIPASGPPSGSRRFCNMESWGPSINSFESFNMYFRYFVQYTILYDSPLNRHYGYFWYHPQGKLQAEEGVGKWSSEALASTVLKLLTWILGILFNILALWKDLFGIVWYHPQG